MSQLGLPVLSGTSAVNRLSDLLLTDGSGHLQVIISGSASTPTIDAADGLTGSSVPLYAVYNGINISGSLVGLTGLSLGATTRAATVAVVDASGNQITSFGGGGTQYADGTTQATPTGTVALGKNPSNVLHSLALDASGNLNVNLSANSFGSVTVTGTVTANQGTANATPWNDNISQVGGSAVSTAASGVQKVGIVGNAGAAFDAATNATPPTNAVQVGVVAATALPSAFTATDLAPIMSDKFGRLIHIANGMRDLIGMQATTVTDNSSHTIITAGASGIFNDIISLAITNSSATAVFVTVSDGTASYIYAIAANGGIMIQPATPIPATSSATAWTATVSSGVSSIYYVAQFVKNK